MHEPSPVSDDPQASAIEQWEYIHLSTGTMHDQVNAFVGELNDRGARGWEVVGFASADRTVGLNAIIAILKRRIKRCHRHRPPSRGGSRIRARATTSGTGTARGGPSTCARAAAENGMLLPASRELRPWSLIEPPRAMTDDALEIGSRRRRWLERPKGRVHR